MGGDDWKKEVGWEEDGRRGGGWIMCGGWQKGRREVRRYKVQGLEKVRCDSTEFSL